MTCRVLICHAVLMLACERCAVPTQADCLPEPRDVFAYLKVSSGPSLLCIYPYLHCFQAKHDRTQVHHACVC